jgi:hypothetical protein
MNSFCSIISSIGLVLFFNSITGLKVPQNNWLNTKHLDAKNIEKLEKLFYLKNSRYSPYKNKYTVRPFLNITEQLENVNNQFIKNYDESKQIDGEYFQCVALPFGWNGSPYFFQKIIRVFAQAIRSQGVIPANNVSHGTTQTPLPSAREHKFLLNYLDNFIA